MDKVFVKDLFDFLNNKEGLVSYFIVSQKEFKEGSKDYYIRMKLADKSGSITANIWNNANHFNSKFKDGDVVKVRGVVISYKDQLQMTINNIKPALQEEYDITDMMLSTSKDVDSLISELFKFIDELENSHLKNLMLEIFEKDKEFFNSFVKSPAAKNWHHNYINGLLEHSVAVTKICAHSADYYSLNKDLLICGGLLHDIGKVFEYNISNIIDFSDMGRLIGHITLGDQFICEKVKNVPNFPDNLLMKLRHLILAHHGEYEKASVRLPQTLEALFLYYADNLDAQVTGVQQLIDGVKIDKAKWTEFDRLNSKYYYIG